MRNSQIFLLLTIFATCTMAFALTSNWKIANGFTVKFNTASAAGEFEKVDGVINFDANNLAASSFNVNVDVASIATGNWLKSRHAKAADWLNASQYPYINFTSTKISKTATGFLTTGNLTMHGVTRSVDIPFTFSNNTFKGSFSVNRTHYQIGSTQGMSKKVGTTIMLELVIPVVMK